MTTAPVRHRFVEFTTAELRARLREALAVYVTAMGYPKGAVEQRAPMWLSHMQRTGWRCIGALDEADHLLGISYGYHGNHGQWWHDQVRRGLVDTVGSAAAEYWMSGYFELTELHVLPEAQGHGLGEQLLRCLLDGPTQGRVLLSTPEGPTRAWRLYRRTGFIDVLRHYFFAGDPRPFAVLGRTLPLEAPRGDRRQR